MDDLFVMKKPTKLQSLYSRTGKSTMDPVPGTNQDASTNGDDKNPSNSHNANTSTSASKNDPPPHQRRFPRPSIFQRARLNGILYRPSDAIFLFRLVLALLLALVRLLYLEFPYLILTGWKNSTRQHAAAWSWRSTVFFATIRTVAAKIQTVGQVRFIGQVLQITMPLQMFFYTGKVKVTKDVQFKVKLDVLLRPERATLSELREELRRRRCSDDPMNPSEGYLESMHPHGQNAPLANIPEEIGTIDDDGTYTLRGEWIEALEDDPPSRTRSSTAPQKPRSKTVILYFHGGLHTFCSPRTHSHFLAELAKETGPGTRVFSLDYRLAPEHPFPAAIHDAFAAYLYLTEPDHAALVLDEGSAVHELAVDPRDIVVAGDSAGGNLAAAFMLYMTKYVQPSTDPKFVLPHASLLLSPWMDVTSALPSAKSSDCHCYCPGPLGTSPFDKLMYVEFLKQNFGSLYVCGSVDLVPNCRNALGVERRWQWYSHLAQHPLVSPSHASHGTLAGFTNTLLQTASHDRLVDETRLTAHRLGLENPRQLIRLEDYRDMVHVHQTLTPLFESARVAIKNLARFIERSEHLRDEHDLHRGVIGSGEATTPTPSSPGTRSYAAMLRKIPVRDQDKNDSQNDKEQAQDQNKGEYVPAYLMPTMVKDKAAADGVEWVMVEQNGCEVAGDEGVPLTVLMRAWPSRGGNSKEE